MDDGGTIERVLVTGPPDAVTGYGLATGILVNWLERREHPTLPDTHTMIGTVVPGSLDSLTRTAARTGLTLQRIVGAGETETYETLTGAAGTGWPERTR